MPDPGQSDNITGPKHDALYDKLSQLKGEFFAEYHTNVDKNRRSYNRDFANDVVPPTWRTRLPPLIPQTARRAIDESADHILYLPKIKVPIRPTNSKHVTEREIAENKRSFLHAYWSQVNNRYNPFGDGRKTLLREGRICVKHTLNWDLVPDRAGKSARKYAAELDKLGRYDFLWIDELLDNKTVFEDPSNHRDPRYVYMDYEIMVEDAKEQFGVYDDFDDDDEPAPKNPVAKYAWMNLDDYQKIRYTEYWTRPTFNADGTWEPGVFIQWVDGTRVNEDENPYPYIPIAIDDAGFGDNYRGAKVSEKFVGMAQHSFDMFVAEAQQMTSWNAASGIIAFPPVKAWNMDDNRVITMGPGELIGLRGDKGQPGSEDIEFAQWPDVPEAVLRLVDKTTQYANSALKMDTLGGAPLAGVDTATEADQQIRNASSKLAGPIECMQRVAVKISKWVLMDVELVLKTGVSIYGTKALGPEVVRIDPKSIKGYYDVSAEFTTSDADAISQMNARFWLEMYRVSPFLSAMTAMERGEVADDPLAEMQKRSAEDILLSPEMRQIRLMAAAQQFGKLSEMMQAMTQQTPETTGIPQGAGGSGMLPNSAEGLVEQPDMMQPERAATFDMSLARRDLQAGEQQMK